MLIFMYKELQQAAYLSNNDLCMYRTHFFYNHTLVTSHATQRGTSNTQCFMLVVWCRVYLFATSRRASGPPDGKK